MISTSGEALIKGFMMKFVQEHVCFVLSSSNRGRLLVILDLMIQKKQVMKQKDLNAKLEFFKRNTFPVVKGHAFPTIVKIRPVGCDPLALVDGFTPVEDNIGLLETRIPNINDVNAHVKSKSIKKSSKRKVWKPTGKVFTNIGYTWRPTGQNFTIVGNACPLTRITTTAEVSLRKPTTLETDTSKPIVILVYSRNPRKSKTNVPVVQIVLWYLESGCSKHMTRDRSQLTNFVNTVKFRNVHVAKILGYGDYQIGNVTISRVYYVEGLGHNLFSIGQFSRHGLVRGLLKLKFEKDHLCSAYAMGKMLMERSTSSSLSMITLDLHRHLSDESEQIIELNLLIKLCVNIMRRLESLIKHPLLALHKAVATACYTQNRIILNLQPTYHSNHRNNYVDFDELIAMAFEHNSLEPALHEMTPATISSGLMPNPPPSTSFIPPSRTKWDLLFQPLFDELLNPLASVDRPAPEVITPIAEVVAPEPAASTVHLLQQLVDQAWHHHLTYKDALTQACWIEAMQEELNKFEHLEVWELVPHPD
ncbi:hypothetical protein Tco_0238177 [Tanacetum coccineum]